MITVNTYNVTEGAVYRGVNIGVNELLKDVSNFSKPEVVVNTITEAVMGQLCDTFDFGIQPIRITPDMIRKMVQESQAQPPQQ